MDQVLPVWKKIADIASKTRFGTKTDKEGNQISQALSPRTLRLFRSRQLERCVRLGCGRGVCRCNDAMRRFGVMIS